MSEPKTAILLATDADEVFDEVDAALGDRRTSVRRVRNGADVLPTVRAEEPDLVVLDLQIGRMGGMATCIGLRLEEGAGRLDRQRVVMLLDRPDDVFLARRSGADGWLVKPLDAFRLRRAADEVMAGGSWLEATEQAG